MSIEELDFNNSQMLRKKAEELLRKKEMNPVFPSSGNDVNKLLHELQVHQIELEMQNEELRQAYVTAETALKKYTMLFDLAPIGYFSLERDGTICELNFTGADLLGEKRFSLMNSNFKLFVSEESRSVFNDFFNKLYITNSNETCEIFIDKINNAPRLVYLEGVVTENEQKCLLSVVDSSKFRLLS